MPASRHLAAIAAAFLMSGCASVPADAGAPCAVLPPVQPAPADLGSGARGERACPETVFGSGAAWRRCVLAAAAASGSFDCSRLHSAPEAMVCVGDVNDAVEYQKFAPMTGRERAGAGIDGAAGGQYVRSLAEKWRAACSVLREAGAQGRQPARTPVSRSPEGP